MESPRLLQNRRLQFLHCEPGDATFPLSGIDELRFMESKDELDMLDATEHFCLIDLLSGVDDTGRIRFCILVLLIAKSLLKSISFSTWQLKFKRLSIVIVL